MVDFPCKIDMTKVAWTFFHGPQTSEAIDPSWISAHPWIINAGEGRVFKFIVGLVWTYFGNT